jgi:hypothetical protein
VSNKWNIKIDESENPNMRGFFVSVENNGEYVGAIKGIINNFDKAISEGRNIILSSIKQHDDKIKYAKVAQDLFTKKYLYNNMYNEIYGVGIQHEGNTESGEPYLNVLMNTKNDYLMKLIPDEISVPNTPFTYKIKKEYSDKIVAQTQQSK